MHWRTLSHLVLSVRQLKQETTTLFRRCLTGLALSLTMLQVLSIKVNEETELRELAIGDFSAWSARLTEAGSA